MKKTVIMILMITSMAFTQAMAATDTDKDGIPDGAEKILRTDPLTADTDGDGINDLRDNDPLNIGNKVISSKGSRGFIIKKVLVEDNYDSARHKDAPDHLEIMLKNISKEDIKDFTVVYRLTDLKTNDAQSYMLPLKGFELKRGESTSVHIDTDNGVRHFRANPNSLYYLSENKRKVDVIVVAKGYQSQEESVKKDAGGAEVAD